MSDYQCSKNVRNDLPDTGDRPRYELFSPCGKPAVTYFTGDGHTSFQCEEHPARMMPTTSISVYGR